MTQPVRTGVIGVGNMGQHHARIYASSPGSALVGVADTNLARAQEIASRYGVEVFTDYRDLLQRVEAVSIAAPTTLHHRIGLDCLAEGIHLLMEKPLAASVTEATELAAAAEVFGADPAGRTRRALQSDLRRAGQRAGRPHDPGS